MTEQELKAIYSQKNAAIIAPAGHGKTEMITEIVRHGTRKQLLLTHTNAGVDALRKRLAKYKVPSASYHISTIAAFCTRWCTAYPKSARFDPSRSISNLWDTEYYSQLYAGTEYIFRQRWALRVLAITYERIVIDEYQDCTIDQHKIFLAMNKQVPVCVLGDPLQGIFEFAGSLVDWNDLEYQIVDVKTKPWRWLKTNPELGKQLELLREQLLPILDGQPCSVDLRQYSSIVEIVNPTIFEGRLHVLKNKVRQFSSVVFITQWERNQISFSRSLQGFFQVDEKVECNDLYEFANRFDIDAGRELILSIIEFAKICATGVGTELDTLIKKIEAGNFDFSRIRKHADFCSLILRLKQSKTAKNILDAIAWFEKQEKVKLYRKELYRDMVRSLKHSSAHNVSIRESAIQIRRDASLYRSNLKYRYLSSRTLLSKGLEFDCVIIDTRNPLKAKDFYVATTRAMRKIYIISSSPVIHFNQ